MTGNILQDEFQTVGTDYAVRKLRAAFFRALDELHPVARTELYEIGEWHREEFEQLVPELRRDREQFRAEAEERLEIAANERGLALYDPDPVNSVLGPLLDARRGHSTYPVIDQVVVDLNAWADTHRMSCDWVLDAGCRMIAAWDDQPPSDHPTTPWPTVADGLDGVGIWTPLSPEEATCRIPFEFKAAWNPTLESIREAKKRVDEAFKAERDQWFREAEATAEANGFIATPNTRKEELHLSWLVRFQVLGQTAMVIFNDPNTADCDPNRIEKAIGRMAKTIGLPKTRRRRRSST